MEGLGYAYCITGWPAAVESRLARKVGAFSRHGGFHQKIGITNSPKTRWRAHAADGWRGMQVIYKSRTWANVCDVETRLIDRFHMGKCRSPGRHHNINAGGGGKSGEAKDGFYYVYLLSAAPYTRFAY